MHKNKKRKTSVVWDHFKKIQVNKGVWKNQYIHCKKYAITNSKATSHLKHHLEQSFLIYKIILAKQKRLNLQPSNSKVSPDIDGPILVTLEAKYDHERQREATAHWIMMHKHAFSVVKELGFVLMIKRNNLEYEKNWMEDLKK
ncbi:hypothetical protein NMG60_11036121 [Bertholletia excelsa]